MYRLNKQEIVASILIILAGCCWEMIGFFSVQISILRSFVLSTSLLLLIFVTAHK